MGTIMQLVNVLVTAVVCALEVESPYFSFIFAFVITLSFWSINSIAVELEHPFGDDPNDLPLLEMQVDLNKSLCALLRPMAATPPSYQFKRETHASLGRITIPLAEYLEELKCSPIDWKFSDLPPEKRAPADDTRQIAMI